MHKDAFSMPGQLHANVLQVNIIQAGDDAWVIVSIFFEVGNILWELDGLQPSSDFLHRFYCGLLLFVLDW